MACNDQLKERCKKVYAKCVAYESEVPEFSELINEECLDIEQVADDIYSLIGGVKEEIKLTDLDNNCLTLPTTLTVKNVIQLLIDTVCAQQTTITTMQSAITTIEAQVLDLQNNTCP